MNAKWTKNKKIWRRKNERGVVLIAVLMFVALILPVTLLILDTVRIESLLPVNEGYTRTAGDEADKGFAVAMAAIMADQDSNLIDLSADYADTTATAPPFIIDTDDDSMSGKHEFDYLAERWARNPDNDTVFLVERSLENWDNGNQDEHSVPARWQLMNVPFGMDDFGEYYQDTDHPRLLQPFEYANGSSNAPAYYLDPSELSMLYGDHEGQSPSKFSSGYLDLGFWQLSPADPNYYQNLVSLQTFVEFIARPASYFRNTVGTPSSTGLGNVGLPTAYGDAPGVFIRENIDSIDRLVYDGFFDYDESIWPDAPVSNQYLAYLPLQKAVAESTWANKYFGSTGGSGFLANMFTTSNREYKPAPGAITKYQLGSSEEEAVPGWYETVVSDESGRFPINRLLNVIYASDNIAYTGYSVIPATRRDQWDADPDELINNDEHPNYGGYLMARDILISLLMPDEVMARMANSFDNNVWNNYANKADYIIRQMLKRRIQLDLNSDIDRNGNYSDDWTFGEVFQYPELTQNNESPTLDTPPDLLADLLDGNGRQGNGQDLWDGTWQIYSNPKEMLSNFNNEASSPITFNDFELLNSRVTLYSMDTEHSADPEHENIGFNGIWDTRYNINRMQPEDDFTTFDVQEDALYDFLVPIIGRQRVQSIINWRDGLVDLNGDGDLNDEYIDQPVSIQRYDMENDVYDDLGDWPVTEITYREKDHLNFQDPSLEPQYIDPDMLNIRNLGDLLTIPMSSSSDFYAFNRGGVSNTPPELVVTDDAGNETTLPGHRMYPDFSSVDDNLAYDDEVEIYTNDSSLGNENNLVAPGKHPSWGYGDALIAYYEGDNLHTYEPATGTDTTVLTNANFPPDIDDTGTETYSEFWGRHGGNLINNADFEMASPDINPSTSVKEICFSQVAPGVPNDVFQDPTSAYNLMVVDVDSSLVTNLTDNSPGTFDFAPDYSLEFVPGLQVIAFTRTTYDHFITWWPPFDDVDIPITNLYITDRTGGFALPLFWDMSLIEPDPDGANPYSITIHQPMFPSWSPDGNEIMFMDLAMKIEVNTASGNITINSGVGNIDSNIYIIDLNNGIFQDFGTDASLVEGNLNWDGTLETFPDMGLSGTLPGSQLNFQNGNLPAIPISLTNSRNTDSPFDDTERETIAGELMFASLALRSQEGSSPGLGGQDQNWTYRDLPTVPSHVVSVLERLADVTSFREPLTEWLNIGGFGGLLHQYPGNININTATRPVLRSLFLMMFQGHVYDIDGTGSANGNGPMPRIEAGNTYLNLRSNAGLMSNQNRFNAMMIADKYAHQVDEYRKWVYNNQGKVGITDETVGSNLPLYEQQFPGITHYGNFRGNPFYPLRDSDGDPDTLEIQRQDPDPPFRNIADLFKVMLYDDDVQDFSEVWTYEGIDSTDAGPDASDLPVPRDTSGAPSGTTDALEVFGPIFNSDNERQITHAFVDSLLDGGVLTGFSTAVDNDPGTPTYNSYYEQQAFRLFSADDFRRIASWVTTRTYNYRIESRGVIRVAGSPRRTDVTRDKVWIVTMNTEAFEGTRENPSTDIFEIYDTAILAQNDGMNEYYVLYFEETPQAGIAVARSNFLP